MTEPKRGRWTDELEKVKAYHQFGSNWRGFPVSLGVLLAIVAAAINIGALVMWFTGTIDIRVADRIGSHSKDATAHNAVMTDLRREINRNAAAIQKLQEDAIEKVRQGSERRRRR